jgi:hypothetical protein
VTGGLKRPEKLGEETGVDIREVSDGATGLKSPPDKDRVGVAGALARGAKSPAKGVDGLLLLSEEVNLEGAENRPVEAWSANGGFLVSAESGGANIPDRAVGAGFEGGGTKKPVSAPDGALAGGGAKRDGSCLAAEGGLEAANRPVNGLLSRVEDPAGVGLPKSDERPPPLAGAGGAWNTEPREAGAFGGGANKDTLSLKAEECGAKSDDTLFNEEEDDFDSALDVGIRGGAWPSHERVASVHNGWRRGAADPAKEFVNGGPSRDRRELLRTRDRLFEELR